MYRYCITQHKQKCDFHLCDAIDEELTVGVKGEFGDPGPSRLSYSQGRSLGQQKALYSNLPVIWKKILETFYLQ
jgi:hypothetical protein